MQLTSQEILNENIVSNYTPEAVQQQGIDVRVDKIFRFNGHGRVPSVGKTQLPQMVEMEFEKGTNFPESVYLTPGYYEVELMEGFNIPTNCTLHFKTRSSMVRCGGEVVSGQFDAGFKTDKGGCFLVVHHGLRLEKHARIAQAIVFRSNEAEAYNGQFQGDKQRS